MSYWIVRVSDIGSLDFGSKTGWTLFMRSLCRRSYRLTAVNNVAV